MNIKNNISAIRKTVGDGVKIIAVTKKRTIAEINEVIKAGITDIGESRLQEAKEKLPKIHKLRKTQTDCTKFTNCTKHKQITKHFIGRLQTNKVAEVVRIFDVIQSVDSLKLAEKISQECGKIGKTMPILIQVNTSDESQKGGVKPKELMELIEKASELPNIRIEGLMTLAVDSDNEGEIRKCFRLLKELFESAKSNFDFRSSKFDFKWLSMGMSGDYKIAIEEGANMVRIGSGIFK